NRSKINMMSYKNGKGILSQLSERRLEITIFIIIILAEFLIYGITKIQPQNHFYDEPQPAHKEIESYKEGNSHYLYRKLKFDPNKDEIFIILHIQKTGGTNFESRLVKTLNVSPSCVCQPEERRCECLNKNGHVWIVSGQFSLKWSCRVHADWTELNGCIDRYFDRSEGLHRNRSYLYITILREPIQRYVSEWMAVQRGARWSRNKIQCNGQIIKELPACYETHWRHVKLDDFINCPHSLAINRQTRMLANLSLVDCYNTSTIPKPERDRIMLESAKNNLRNMAYFGLTEYQELNQHLFEFTFGVNFTKDFSQNLTTYANGAKNVISSSQLKRIKELNNLDIKLYKYAKKLYFQRL
ncbi:unnamed protein product, partial [Owenia fusiformis]